MTTEPPSKQPRQSKMKHLAIRIVIALLCVSIANPIQPALAEQVLDPNDTNIIFDTDLPPESEDACQTPAGSDSDIDRFLKALAEQESGGNINAVSAGDARGKYQYIDTTWQAHAQQYYPPAAQYPTALDPPEDIREAVQDALAYFEYTAKLEQFEGDLFRLAVSHFYPLALEDEKYLDIVPDSNVITPREYAEQFVAKVNAGAGADIELHYREAPEFAAIAAERNAQPENAQNKGDCQNNGVIAGDIVKTALNFAWDTTGHGKTMEDAKPAYQTAMPEFNGTVPINETDFPYSDCGVFVATVMRASGADPNYPIRGTGVQLPYLEEQAAAGKYKLIRDHGNDVSKLMPGDILIANGGLGGGHTYIFIGQDNQRTWNSVGASNGSHVPQATIAFPPGEDRLFTVARLIK